MFGQNFQTKIKAFEKRFLPYRRIRAQKMGLWFTGLMATMGFLTLLGENNILYLLFSCQIAIVIVSGILSEYTVSRLEVLRRPGDSFAQENCGDNWTLKNEGILPAINIRVGEWKNEEFICHAIVKMILPGDQVNVQSLHEFSKRGLHSWDGIAWSSDFPFGFSQKIRILRESGERLIWPKRLKGSLQAMSQSVKLVQLGNEIREGEVRVLQIGEVWADIVRHRRSPEGMPLTRARGQERERLIVEIDLDSLDPADLENTLSRIAFYAAEDRIRELVIKSTEKALHRSIEGRLNILNTISTIGLKEGNFWTAKNAS